MSSAMIQDGIKFLRSMSMNGLTSGEVAAENNVSLDYVNDCIVAAREHRDEAFHKKPKVTLVEPYVKIFKDLGTGELQIIESIEIEILRDLIVKFAREEQSEFQTMLPVTVRIKRKV